MASSTSPLLLSPSSPIKNPNSPSTFRLYRRRKNLTVYMAASSKDDDALPSSQKHPKLVTFLGKGGSGKTTSAVFAAQHYAMAGLKTCLVLHSQDPTAEYLLNCKIGISPTTCSHNLSAVRVESTKMLLEPLNRLKQADARLNMTQGVLEGVVGEELGVLPGMDSIFSALALERLLGFFGNIGQKKIQKEKFDVIIYDGVSTEETIRMIGAAGKARLYLKYMRNLAEKTDLGRLAGPSILRLVDESIGLSSNSSSLNGKTGSEIWDDLEQILEMGSSVFADPHRFGCYLVTDPKSPTSLNSALRYWGCAIQASAQVSGAFGIGSSSSCAETVEKTFMPLPCASIPHISMASPINWNEIVPKFMSKDAKNLLSGTSDKSGITRTVKFDPSNKSITLLMPGFDKSEIKLYQYRGGSELLVEAGDQRRVIRLPSQIQGRVGGAKFVDRSLIITMR